MRLLVTGGAGFIGSNYILHTLRVHPGWQIMNLDKLTYAANLDNLKGVENHPSYHFAKGDVADEEFVRELFVRHGFDSVVHLAAESHVDRSITDCSAFVRTNIEGTRVLLEAARRFGVKRFLQVSTDEVYGSLSPGEPPFTEASPLKPNNPYSASKASADMLASAYHNTYGLPVVISRCSNNYGPCQHAEKFVPVTILNALECKPIPVYGDGRNVRDWIHVSDHCCALDLILTGGRIGEVYNVGANNERTNISIVREALTLLGRSDELIRYVKDRPGHDKRYAIAATKIRKELGWRPRVSFERGLSGTVEWYKSYRETTNPRTPG